MNKLHSFNHLSDLDKVNTVFSPILRFRSPVNRRLRKGEETWRPAREERVVGFFLSLSLLDNTFVFPVSKPFAPFPDILPPKFQRIFSANYCSRSPELIWEFYLRKRGARSFCQPIVFSFFSLSCWCYLFILAPELSSAFHYGSASS